MDTIVKRNEDEGRYELHIDGALVSYADYLDQPGVVVVTHVETHPDHRDNGHAARLMDGVIDDVVERGLKIVPRCGFARAHLAERSDGAELVAR